MVNLEPLLEAACLAARLCRAVQEGYLSSSEKTGHEPVTIADYGSQAIFCRAVMRHFPGDAVIAEETGQQFVELVAPEQKAQIVRLVADALGERVDEAALATWLDYGKEAQASRTWLIDPIDGTKGFLALRHYVNAVALLEDGRLTAGIVSAPAYPGQPGGALFYSDGGGAYRQSFNGGGRQSIHVTARDDPMALRALESAEKTHVSHERLARVRAAAGLGGVALEQVDSQEKYARIAAGDAELYLRMSRIGSTRPHMAWDHAPGAALVMAAGGRVSGLAGEPLDCSQGRILNNAGVIATNGPIHDRMVEAVQRVLALEAAENA